MIPDICSMHILLAAATTFEIQPAIDLLGETASLRAGKASPGSQDSTATLITGVGNLATVYSLIRQIDRHRPDVIIQAGIAGCFTGRLPGEVVVVGEEVLADQGVWEDGRFKTIFDMKLADPDADPFSEGLLVNPYKKLLTLTALESVRGITVNEISTDPARIGWHQQNTAPVVESMEGGGLHYVCLREKIAFLQLRSVSNEIGVRDKTKWDLKKAIANLNEQLIALLKKLSEKDKTVLEPMKYLTS
jgi:futalosine hydrolase